ncbi:hypothetical protein [Salinirarus marinus]|uniref:hypothetical protein n=1 Tax=Salinirarus marinus TaxID=3068310 RepID=UPI003C6C47F8
MASRTLRTRNTLLLAVVLVSGVVLPGLARWWLGTLGLDTLGSAVFTVGYATAAFVVWYGWIRPIDFTGSAER